MYGRAQLHLGTWSVITDSECVYIMYIRTIDYWFSRLPDSRFYISIFFLFVFVKVAQRLRDQARPHISHINYIGYKNVYCLYFLYVYIYISTQVFMNSRVFVSDIQFILLPDICGFCTLYLVILFFIFTKLYSFH